MALPAGQQVPAPAPEPDQAPTDQPEDKPRVVFQFEGPHSTLFRYARENVSVFQLALMLDVLQPIVDREMMEWWESNVSDAENIRKGASDGEEETKPNQDPIPSS